MKNILIYFLFILFSGYTFANNPDTGQTYKISSSISTDKSLAIRDASLNNDADIVNWTETNVNAQRWTLTADDENKYQLTNAYSGKILFRRGTAVDGAKIGQYTHSGQAAGKWEILPVENQAGFYYITQMHRDGEIRLYMELTSTDEGASPELKTRKEGPDANRQIWKLETAVVKPNLLTQELAAEMMSAWKAKYYKKAPTGYVIANGGWWGDAEMFEMILDAYETTGNPEYETMFRELYTNFIYRNKTDWLYNEYNDDITWMVIASARAYLMLGDPNYLTYAKTNFDRMYARALLPSGMLRWKETQETINGTNSCINAPAEVAACYLAIATSDENYYKKAKDLYLLQRRYLYAPATGQVYDSFIWLNDKPSNYNYWASTYNQGTFLGAAVMLYNHYGDNLYKEDAEKIMKYTRKELCDNNGIIHVCQVASGDLAGFKGILMRYVRRFICDLQKAEYTDWLQKNALHAYNNRNSSGVCSSAWLTKTPENFIFQSWVDQCRNDCEKNNNCESDYYTSCENKNNLNQDAFGPSTAVSVAFNALPAKELITKDAFSKIEAENFDYLKGIYVETDNNQTVVANVKNGFYTIYKQVNMGNNLAKSIEIRLSKSSFRGSVVEIRLDSPQGDSIGTVLVPREGDDWQTISQEITPIEGKQTICLLFKGMENQNNLFKIDYFHLKTNDLIYTDVTDNGGEIQASIEINGLKNLIDNRLNTTIAAPVNNALRLQYKSPFAVAPKGYALASAADDPEKDPKTWSFQTSNNGVDWTNLDTQSNEQFTARHQKKSYTISTAEKFTHFRLLITATRGNTTETQLSEWQIYGSSIAENDITADGGTLSAEYNGNESEETFVNLTDKNADSKYLVKDQTDLWMQYKANAVYKLNVYSLTSANDEPERDPKNWDLFGSEDGNNWTLIDSRLNQQFNHRQATQFYTCNNKGGYLYFKLHITANYGSAMTQLSEWQLFGEFYIDRFYFDITSNGGELTSSQDAAANSAALPTLTDDNANTAYQLNAQNLPVWIQYKSTTPAILQAYSITAGDDNKKNPKNWTVQASNDGITWTNIHTRSNISFALLGERKTYTLTTNDKYQYFRLNITKLSDDNSTELKIGELELYGAGIEPEDITANGGALTSEYPGINSNEGLPKLTDKSENTKYCTNFYGSAWMYYLSPAPVKITAYSITSANDNENRDPQAWTLEASPDGINWETIDTRQNQYFPYRYTTQYYACNKAEKEYPHFRLNITGNAGANLLQLAEWQLLNRKGNPEGIRTPKPDEDVSLYPVPTTGILYLDMPSKGRIQLHNLSGQLILARKVEQGLQTIHFEKQEKGLYFLYIDTGNKQISKKIIKR
jgi:predicted alpha-1,6-mannanase (GH76 family)